MLVPLTEEDGRVCTRERAYDLKSLFPVLLCGETVRMTVEYYDTIRETLFWRPIKHGKREDGLQGIRTTQHAIMHPMRYSFFSRSEVVAIQKSNGGTSKNRVVVPFGSVGQLKR
jgi:hypothetical protein